MKEWIGHFVAAAAITLVCMVAGNVGAMADPGMENCRKCLEEAQKRAAANLRSQLPAHIDEHTTLYSVFSAGTTLVYNYKVDFFKIGCEHRSVLIVNEKNFIQKCMWAEGYGIRD